MSCLCLEALGILDKGVLLQLLLDDAHIDMVHLVADRIAARTLEQDLDFLLVQKTLDRTILNMDIHLATHIDRLVRAIECRDSQ
jgi:hypothetical protein